MERDILKEFHIRRVLPKIRISCDISSDNCDHTSCDASKGYEEKQTLQNSLQGALNATRSCFTHEKRIFPQNTNGRCSGTQHLVMAMIFCPFKMQAMISFAYILFRESGFMNQ